MKPVEAGPYSPPDAAWPRPSWLSLTHDAIQNTENIIKAI